MNPLRRLARRTYPAVDTVQVTDSLGNVASVQVIVGSGLAVNPSAPMVAPRGGLVFTTTGGSGTGLAWTISTNASGGTISSSGAYTAGATGNVTDVVTVTDSLGNTGTAHVSVGAGLAILPGSALVAPLGSQAFTVSGGSGKGYTWSGHVYGQPAT
jgi:hypothetical protein